MIWICDSKYYRFSAGWVPHNKWWTPRVPLWAESSESPPRDRNGEEPSGVDSNPGVQNVEPSSKSGELEWRVRPGSKKRRGAKVGVDGSRAHPSLFNKNKGVPASLETITDEKKIVTQLLLLFYLLALISKSTMKKN